MHVRACDVNVLTDCGQTVISVVPFKLNVA